MDRRWLAGAAAAALITTWAGGRAHAVVLRYTPKVGAVHRYEVTADGAMEMTIEAMGDASRTKTAAEVKFEQKVLSQTGEVTRVQADLLGGKSTTTSMEGQTQSVQVPTGRAVVEVDRRARITKMVETDLEGEDVSQSLGPWAEFLSNWSQFCAFPEGDVRVDDSWTARFTSRLPLGGEGIEMSIKSQLLDLTSLQGRQYAKIRTTFSGPLKLEGSEMGPFGGAGPTTGSLQGDLTWYYDHENSVVVRGEGSASMDRSRFLHGPLGPGMPDRATVSTKMLVNVKVALVQ